MYGGNLRSAATCHDVVGCGDARSGESVVQEAVVDQQPSPTQATRRHGVAERSRVSRRRRRCGPGLTSLHRARQLLRRATDT